MKASPRPHSVAGVVVDPLSSVSVRRENSPGEEEEEEEEGQC